MLTLEIQLDNESPVNRDATVIGFQSKTVQKIFFQRPLYFIPLCLVLAIATGKFVFTTLI